MIRPGPEAIASRRLLLHQGKEQEPVLVELGPLKERDAAVSCEVRIAGEDSESSQDIFGIDGVQALQLALRYAGSRLNAVADSSSYFIEGSDEPGHGFEYYVLD
jgi:uncharacterized protein DUF6968